MIACAAPWTWIGFWIFGLIVGIILMGMGRNPAHLAVVDVRDLSKASHPPKGPDPS